MVYVSEYVRWVRDAVVAWRMSPTANEELVFAVSPFVLGFVLAWLTDRPKYQSLALITTAVCQVLVSSSTASAAIALGNVAWWGIAAFYCVPLAMLWVLLQWKVIRVRRLVVGTVTPLVLLTISSGLPQVPVGVWRNVPIARSLTAASAEQRWIGLDESWRIWRVVLERDRGTVLYYGYKEPVLFRVTSWTDWYGWVAVRFEGVEDSEFSRGPLEFRGVRIGRVMRLIVNQEGIDWNEFVELRPEKEVDRLWGDLIIRMEVPCIPI